ncbi:MAG: hypothetical protein K2J70_05480 [Muribaculaceae bacterium]|nr:hypothetical protein [Muribaculaceae bacterium]
MKIIEFISVFLILLIASCGSDHDERLDRVSDLTWNSPREAISVLDSIDEQALNQDDHYFYNLMKIKVNDKLYIPHKSDSIVRGLLDYYQSDKESMEYLETVYYCGRVYNDLGDLPTAMRFYQEAIKLTDENCKGRRLEIRGNTLSMLINILGQIRLFNENLSMIRRLILVDTERRDTAAIIADNISLCIVNLKLDSLQGARASIINIRKLLRKEQDNLKAMADLYEGAILYKEGRVKEAADKILPNVFRVDSFSQSASLNYAALVHASLGNSDSARNYAKRLIQRDDPVNKKNGYDILLKTQVKSQINIDSVLRLIDEYRQVLNEELNKNADRQTLIQQSFYNYAIHDYHREQAEKQRDLLWKWVAILVVLVALFFILYLSNLLKSKKHVIRLHEALELINELEKKNSRMKSNCETMGNEEREEDEELGSRKSEVEILREKLEKRIKALGKSSGTLYRAPEEILNSPVYNTLTVAIAEDKSLVNNVNFWSELEAEVLKVSKDFKKNMTILLGRNIREAELQTALLVKCGISPSEMGIVLRREKGTISNRRSFLGGRLLGKKVDTETADRVMRML